MLRLRAVRTPNVFDAVIYVLANPAAAHLIKLGDLSNDELVVRLERVDSLHERNA